METQTLPALATIRDIAEYAKTEMRRVQYLAQARGVKPYERVGTVRLYDRKGQQDILEALNLSQEAIAKIADPQKRKEVISQGHKALSAERDQWEIDALTIGFDEDVMLQNSIKAIQKRQAHEDYTDFYRAVLRSLRSQKRLVGRSYDEILEQLGERRTRWLFGENEEGETETATSLDPSGTWSLEAAGLLPAMYELEPQS